MIKNNYDNGEGIVVDECYNPFFDNFHTIYESVINNSNKVNLIKRIAYGRSELVQVPKK